MRLFGKKKKKKEKTIENLPYGGAPVLRNPTKQIIPNPSAEDEINIWFTGLPESGKTAVFKQMAYCGGVRYSVLESQSMTFDLYKQIVYGYFNVASKLEVAYPDFLKTDLGKGLRDLKSSIAKRFPRSQEQRGLGFPEIDIKERTYMLKLWESEVFQKAFEDCKRDSKIQIFDSFGEIIEALRDNPEIFQKLGTSKFNLTNQKFIALSGSPKHPLLQELKFEHVQNPGLRTAPIAKSQYYSRPDLRPNTLKVPLNILTNGESKKTQHWRIILRDVRAKELPPKLENRDCMIFTIDISAFDTVHQVATKKGVKLDTNTSILTHSIETFKTYANRGHVVACIFTHIDLFWRKYQQRKVPINVLGEFPDAPVWEDEQDGAIKIALEYFQSILLRERHEAYRKLEGTDAELKNDVFKVFCVNTTDISNVQATLRAVLEQFMGLNIPVNASKLS